MTYPTLYTRQSDFSDLEANDPADGLSGIGVELDAELNAIKTYLDALDANIRLLQRADGALANGIVTQDSLSTGLTVGVNPATAWVTATAYEVGEDLVWNNGILYVCTVDHTSGTFATDLAAGKWTLVLDLASEVPGVTGVYGRAVTALTDTGSPYTLTEADNGKFYTVDSSAGNVTINLPDSAGLADPDFCRFKFIRTSASNTVTIARGGSDTINGATSFVISAVANTHVDVYATGGTAWRGIEFKVPNDDSVTSAKIAANGVATADITDLNVTEGKIAAFAVTPGKVDAKQAADQSPSSGTVTLDMNTNRRIKITATGNFTFDVTPPTSRAGTAIVECVNWGAHTVTLTGIDNVPGGNPLSFTVSGTDLLGIEADDDGVVNAFFLGKGFV